MSEATPGAAAETSRWLSFDGVPPGALVLLAGAWLLSLVTQGFIIIPASIVDQITAATGVDDATAVWLVSATPGAWAASNFMVGTVIDRWGDVRVTAAGTALFVATAVWCFLAARRGDFASLLAARIVAGVAIGAIWTAGANLVGRAFPAATSGTAIGVFTASAPAGEHAAAFGGRWLACTVCAVRRTLRIRLRGLPVRRRPDRPRPARPRYERRCGLLGGAPEPRGRPRVGDGLRRLLAVPVFE